MLRHRFRLLLVMGCAIVTGAASRAEATLTFSGSAGTLDLYYSGVLMETLGPVSTRCGSNATNWATFSLNGLDLRLYDSYSGPGGVYCGVSCVEAHALTVAMLRVILYVHPQTGLPLSKHNGGVPVSRNLTAGNSILSWNAGATSVFQCNGSYSQSSYWGQSLLRIGSAVAEQHQKYPICGATGFTSTIFSGSGVPILGYIAMTGSHCSHVNVRTGSFPFPVVTVDADRLIPDEIFPGAGLASAVTPSTLRVRNLARDPLTNLVVRLYALEGAILDSLVVPEVAGGSIVSWTVPYDLTNVALRTTATSMGAPVLGTDDAALIYGVLRTLAPFTLLRRPDGTQNLTDLRRFELGYANYGRAKIGDIGVEFASGLPLGVTVDPGPIAELVNDEFDSPVLSDLWTIENPSSPASSISTSERPGFLRIRASASNGGSAYSGDNHRMPRVAQLTRGDWDFETKIEFTGTDGAEATGLMLDQARVIERGYAEQTPANYLYLFGQMIAYSDPVLHLKLQQRGNTLQTWYRGSAGDWIAVPNQQRTTSSLGLYGLRFNQTAGNSHDAIADIDYVRFTNQNVSVPPSLNDALEVRVVPQPASNRVAIHFDLPRVAQISAAILDLSGRVVRRLADRPMSSGPQSLEWDGVAEDGARVRSGVYFVRLVVDGVPTRRKVVVTR